MLVQDERLTRRVGTVVLLLIAAAIAFVVFIYDQLEWGRHVRIGVYFHGTTGLREGAPVIVGGRTIGTIEAIALSPRGAPGPLDGDEGVVLRVAIPAREAARVTRGGDVFVASQGPLGARYLELGPAPGPGPSLDEDPSPLLGSDPPSIDRVLQNTWENLTVARAFAEQISPELDALSARLDELGATLDGLAPNVAGVAGLGLEIAALLDEARTLRDVALGGDPGLAKLARVADHARATLDRARAVVDVLGARAAALSAGTTALRARLGDRGAAALRAVELAIERTRAALAKLDPLLATVADLSARLARGEGSLGRLMTDPEFPEDAKALGKILKRQPWRIMARPDK